MLRFVNKLCSGVLTMHAHATDLRDPATPSHLAKRKRSALAQPGTPASARSSTTAHPTAA